MGSRGGARVLIAGNGAVGLCIALAVKDVLNDTEVLVVGPRLRPGGASQAAGAMLGVFGEVTKATLDSEPGRAKFELARQAHGLWPAMLARLRDTRSDTAQVHETVGTYVIHNARGGALDSENVEALVAAAGEFDARLETVTEIPGLDPRPDGRPLVAFYLPDEGSVDATAVLLRLEALCESRGVQLLDDHVTAIHHAHGRATGASLASGNDVDADHVVLATGAFTSPLLRGLPLERPVQPVFAGSGVAYEAERVMGTGFRNVVRTINRAGSCGLHVVPLGGSREYYGATNVIFGEPEMRAHLGVCHFVAGCAMDQLDQAIAYSRIDAIRVGNRPVPLDTFPLLGPTSLPGLTLVTGTYRDGFHAAPLLAQLTAATLHEGASRFPEVFAPEREPLFLSSVEESVEEFVHQSIASAVEGATSLTPFMWTHDLGEVFRPRAQDLYRNLGLDKGLHSDVVTYLTTTRKDPRDVDELARYLSSVGVIA